MHTIVTYKECANAFSSVAASFFTAPKTPSKLSPVIYKGSILEGWQPETVMFTFQKRHGMSVTEYLAKEDKEARKIKEDKDLI